MKFRHSAAALFALTSAAFAEAREVPALTYNDLQNGQRFEIRTEDQTYVGRLVDGSTGKCLIQDSNDGQSFSHPRTVYLLGATQGQQAGFTFVKMHEVQVGMKMELGLDDLNQENRLVTSRVQSIRID